MTIEEILQRLKYKNALTPPVDTETRIEAAELIVRLKQRNEYLHKMLGEKIPGAKPNLWIVIISRGGERFNAEFNDKEQAEAVYNAEIRTNSPAVLYECVATRTFVPLIDLDEARFIDDYDEDSN
jgi:hypothetical protein